MHLTNILGSNCNSGWERGVERNGSQKKPFKREKKRKTSTSQGSSEYELKSSPSKETFVVCDACSNLIPMYDLEFHRSVECPGSCDVFRDGDQRDGVRDRDAEPTLKRLLTGNAQGSKVRAFDENAGKESSLDALEVLCPKPGEFFHLLIH